MTPRNPPRFARTLLTLIAGRNDALMGDLQEQFQHGRSRSWYWRQVMGIGAHDRRCLRMVTAWAVFAAVLMATIPTAGWGTSRFAVPLALGIAITSWGLWRFHRTTLAMLYAVSVALVLPHWMMADDLVLSGGDRVFWAIARVLAGYGVVGVLLVPFLILRLGRSGPLSEPPTSLSLSGH